MVVYGLKSYYSIYFTDGEYDSYRKCVVGMCYNIQEAKDIVAAFNLLHEAEIFESDVYNSIYEEYRPSHDARFYWEEIPTFEFKED